MLTIHERERAAYISGNPQAALLAELLDADDDKASAERATEEAQGETDAAERERDRLVEKVDELLIAVADLFYSSREYTDDERAEIGDLLTEVDVYSTFAAVKRLRALA